MNTMLKTVVVLIGGAFLVGGCASVQPRAGFDDVQKMSVERTGFSGQWNTQSAADNSVEQSVQALLASEISADQAVQIALLNNRTIQATFEELGISQADLVQAGLLKNPVFNVSTRIADGGGGTNVEFGVTEDFIQLFTLPLRKRLAENQFEATKLRVAGAVVDLAIETRKAYYAVQGAVQMLELRKTVAEASAASFEIAKRIHDAGNSSDVTFGNEEAMFAQSKIDLAQAETDMAEGRERLVVLLGLWGENIEVKTGRRLPELPPVESNLEGLESVAVSKRLDLLAIERETSSAAQSMGISKSTALFPEAQIGVDGERDAAGGWVTGPNVSVPIPIFDGGQASVARAHAVLRQLQQRFHAKAVEVRSQVRVARNHMLSARQRVEFYHKTILPLREKLVEKTQLEYNGMLVGVFQLIQAKQAQVNAGREYIEALHDYWIARTELEGAIGTHLPDSVLMSPASQPVITGDKSPVEHHHSH